MFYNNKALLSRNEYIIAGVSPISKRLFIYKDIPTILFGTHNRVIPCVYDTIG